MASKKPINDGQVKAHQSSGPKTEVGKEIASCNATKHGILSRRLFLEDEDPREFDVLLNQLIADLHPVGPLEMFILERMAITIWRQIRLVRSETAQIELERRTGSEAMRIEAARVIKTDESSIVQEDFQPLSESEEKDLKRYQEIVEEYQEGKKKFDQYSPGGDQAELDRWAPIIYKKLKFRAIAFDNNIDKFLKSEDQTLAAWAKELAETSEKEAAKLSARQQLSGILELLRVALSIPERHALIGRYQTSLDNDLYKAQRALQRAQEWRHKVIEQDAGSLSEEPHDQQEDEGDHADWQAG